MDTLAQILIAVISILVGIFATVFITYIVYYKGRFERLNSEHKTEIEKLKMEYDKKIEQTNTPTSVALQKMIHLIRVKELFVRKLDNITKGNIELDILDTSAVWSQMFREGNIFFLRATSLISPEMWDDEFMRKYQGEQRKLVDNLERLKSHNPTEYQQIIRRLEPIRSEQIAELNNLETNFERTFIIRGGQLANSATLMKLSELISSQSVYMGVKVIYENKVPPEDMKDFGIALSKEGDILIYELNIIGEILYGGRIYYQPEKIVDALARYNRIGAQSTPIPKNSTYSEVVDIVSQVAKTSGAKIEPQVIEEAKRKLEAHKCLICFLSTEMVMGTMQRENWRKFPLYETDLCEKVAESSKYQDWTTLPSNQQSWYQIIDIENKKALEYVTQKKPRKLIEIGCGPGRLISLILRIGNYTYDEIVGIDGDEQMYNMAYHRFPPAEYPNIDILHMIVKNKLPYPPDHFDFCINAMNIVGWQENEIEWLNAMLRCSFTTFFTLYKKGYEERRVAMYKKDHINKVVSNLTKKQVKSD